ncbi:hypothetical protein BG011_000151 [Mortierella polycephala]|uniref:Uncharacterized protein n=1 Tax=Mortierella polycephala TaxID=41804 RepID=A0A9P6PMU9_9FUNG|nr:hypothetical protein BG011_000151 [Mortierella polycephala]
MPILRSIPILYTLKRPTLDQRQHQPELTPAQQVEEAERGHAVLHDDLGDYPDELFQLRVRTLQDHLSKHYPNTIIYIVSLIFVLLALIVLVATLLGLHATDGKPWVLGFIAIMILVFISKMSFLSRIEKAHKGIHNTLQSFNDQDMPHYGVLYRLRPMNHYSVAQSSWLIRCAYRLNLGLPCWAIDLTTIDHIDEHSFQDHPASDPHASPEEILARENELPTYRPKADDDSPNQDIVLDEALPPQYQEVVLELTNLPSQPAPAHLGDGAPAISISSASSHSSPPTRS